MRVVGLAGNVRQVGFLGGARRFNVSGEIYARRTRYAQLYEDDGAGPVGETILDPIEIHGGGRFVLEAWITPAIRGRTEYDLSSRLSVATDLIGSDTVELSVTDTGIGISPEDRERLFLPYFSTKNRGTGLGLAIVHHILQDHGAQIRVEENRPTGARFVVEISAQTDMENPAVESRSLETSA